jgi:acetyl-CoA acetyltransferase
VAIVGVGETTYYRRGAAPVPEFVLVCEAITRAAADAGVSLAEIDGFASYGDDRNTPVRVAAALGIREIGFSNMFWGGGGGGVAGAVGNAAAGLIAGFTRYAVVYRGLAQGQFMRFGRAQTVDTVSGQLAYSAPYGIITPAQTIALRTMRFMHDFGITQDALAAIALTSYAHAQRNERAVMYGRPLTRAEYDASRWIVEPFHLFDCCQENDGAAAVLLTTTDRARDLRQPPAYLLGAAQGSGDRHDLFTHLGPDYASANFKSVAPRLYAMAGIGPDDVDVLQAYENFTGGVMMALAEHGFCTPEGVQDLCVEANLHGPDGRLPLNTSGGNLAECYMHGLELVNEAVRQIRGTSTCQVAGAEISMVIGGPAAAPVSSLVLHR